jgi:hypothetical protein
LPVPPVPIEPPAKLMLEVAPPVLAVPPMLEAPPTPLAPPVLLEAPPAPVAPPVLTVPPMLEAPATLLASLVFVTDVDAPPVPEPPIAPVVQLSRSLQVVVVSQAVSTPATNKPKAREVITCRVFIVLPFIRNHLECRVR